MNPRLYMEWGSPLETRGRPRASPRSATPCQPARATLVLENAFLTWSIFLELAWKHNAMRRWELTGVLLASLSLSLPPVSPYSWTPLDGNVRHEMFIQSCHTIYELSQTALIKSHFNYRPNPV